MEVLGLRHRGVSESRVQGLPQDADACSCPANDVHFNTHETERTLSITFLGIFLPDQKNTFLCGAGENRDLMFYAAGHQMPIKNWREADLGSALGERSVPKAAGHKSSTEHEFWPLSNFDNFLHFSSTFLTTHIRHIHHHTAHTPNHPLLSPLTRHHPFPRTSNTRRESPHSKCRRAAPPIRNITHLSQLAAANLEVAFSATTAMIEQQRPERGQMDSLVESALKRRSATDHRVCEARTWMLCSLRLWCRPESGMGKDIAEACEHTAV